MNACQRTTNVQVADWCWKMNLIAAICLLTRCPSGLITPHLCDNWYWIDTSWMWQIEEGRSNEVLPQSFLWNDDGFVAREFKFLRIFRNSNRDFLFFEVCIKYWLLTQIPYYCFSFKQKKVDKKMQWFEEVLEHLVLKEQKISLILSKCSKIIHIQWVVKITKNLYIHIHCIYILRVSNFFRSFVRNFINVTRDVNCNEKWLWS